MLRKVCALAAVAAALACGSAQADTLTAWVLLGEPGDQVSTKADPLQTAANITGSSLTRGAGLTGSAGANSFSSTGWNGTDAGDYFEFGFTVAPGYTVDLDELYIGTRSSNTGPGTLGLYTSLDGYTTPVATFTQNFTDFLNSAVDLSALTGITGTFTARLYEIGDTQADGVGATAGTGTFRTTAYFVDGSFDRDVQFTGSVAAIPEPSSLLLLGLGGLGATLFVARRRKRAS